MVAGRRRVQGDVRTTRTATLAVLQERGYAYATVNVLEAEGSAPGHVALYVIAEPGPQAVFGTITVRGNDGVSDGRVKSLLSMKEGQQFRISRVVDTQRRLYNREIFQFVSVNAEPTGTVGAPVPVNVVLTQAKPRRLSITPGYGSEEKARITTTLRHLNFFGGARTALATAALVVAGSRRAAERRGALAVPPRHFDERRRPVLVRRRTGLPVDDQGRARHLCQAARAERSRASQAVADDVVGDRASTSTRTTRSPKRPSTTRTSTTT